jgi:hypothetical protein
MPAPENRRGLTAVWGVFGDPNVRQLMPGLSTPVHSMERSQKEGKDHTGLSKITVKENNLSTTKGNILSVRFLNLTINVLCDHHKVNRLNISNTAEDSWPLLSQNTQEHLWLRCANATASLDLLWAVFR